MTTRTTNAASTDRQAIPDLRPQLSRGQHWVAELITGVTADQLDRPTPCTDLEVRQLVRHLIAGAERVRVMAEGGDARSVPFVAEVDDDDLGRRYAEVTAGSQLAWQQHTDLSFAVTAPWGEVPAAAAIGGYLTEVITHGWDLAVATGQPAEAEVDLATAALAAAQRGIPVQRGEGIPFGPVIEPAANATPTERLVSYLGRSADQFNS
jgi:uncharacterized protein (TIGR03086 family)